jgi:anion-transporting  ArsA/GET3 family ATPase
VQSHDYIAMERLYEIHKTGTYDLIVVDTPPTRNAIDFLAAPDRMADFFSSRLLRWLTAPSKSRVMSFASKPFYTVADRILGSQFLEDIAEFFSLFQLMAPGFVERAESVTRTLSDRRTTFVVVSTLESAPLHEAEYFVEALDERKLHLGALILNKVLPSYLRRTATTPVARALCADPEVIAAKLDGGDDPEATARVLGTIGESFLNYQVVAKREAEQRADLGRTPDVVATVPYFEADIHDLAGLLQLGNQIWLLGLEHLMGRDGPTRPRGTRRVVVARPPRARPRPAGRDRPAWAPVHAAVRRRRRGRRTGPR